MVEFAAKERLRTGDFRYVSHALACQHAAIKQGHRGSIKAGATRAATQELNFRRAFYLLALMEDAEPLFAGRRWDVVDELNPDESERIERPAVDWRTSSEIKNTDEFLRELSVEGPSTSVRVWNNSGKPRTQSRFVGSRSR